MKISQYIKPVCGVFLLTVRLSRTARNALFLHTKKHTQKKSKQNKTKQKNKLQRLPMGWSSRSKWCVVWYVCIVDAARERTMIWNNSIAMAVKMRWEMCEQQKIMYAQEENTQNKRDEKHQKQDDQKWYNILHWTANRQPPIDFNGKEITKVRIVMRAIDCAFKHLIVTTWDGGWIG